MYCNKAEMFSVTQDFKVCLELSTDVAIESAAHALHYIPEI